MCRVRTPSSVKVAYMVKCITKIDKEFFVRIISSSFTYSFSSWTKLKKQVTKCKLCNFD